MQLSSHYYTDYIAPFPDLLVMQAVDRPVFPNDIGSNGGVFTAFA
jgi:hypothetical protein